MSEDRKQLTIEEFKSKGKDLFGNDMRKWKFKCPCCGEVQTYNDFIEAGFEQPDTLIGFSCIGRKVAKRGCDWTLGGLLQIHTLELIDENGKTHPHFEFAEG